MLTVMKYHSIALARSDPSNHLSGLKAFASSPKILAEQAAAAASKQSETRKP
jgi:hypothetical protein